MLKDNKSKARGEEAEQLYGYKIYLDLQPVKYTIGGTQTYIIGNLSNCIRIDGYTCVFPTGLRFLGSPTRLSLARYGKPIEKKKNNNK